MIRVETHSRGLLLSVEDGATRNSLIRQLETRSGGKQILVFKGQVILPITLAGDVRISFVRREARQSIGACNYRRA
jgi:hypothetical protein